MGLGRGPDSVPRSLPEELTGTLPLLGAIFISCDCCNTLSPTAWLTTTRIYPFTVLGAKSLKSRHRAMLPQV